MLKSEKIERSWLFQNLTAEQIALFLSAAVELSLEKQKCIAEEGELGNSLFLLLEGEVKILQPLTLGVPKLKDQKIEQSITHLKASNEINFFGEMSFISPGPRSATVQAVTNCKLLEITTEAFHKKCEIDPKMGYQIIRLINLKLTNIIRKNNKSICKLTTALALSLNR